MTPKIVIGLVGQRGAGKGLFTETVKKLRPDLRISTLRFHDPLYEILEILGRERTRENLQTLATSLRQGFNDEGVLVPALKKRLQNLDSDIVFLDGLRKPQEVGLIREAGGFLVYITADKEPRFKRRCESPEYTDELKMSWEQFLRQENAATEIYIRTVGETLADHQIENNGSILEFETTIERFFQSHIQPRLV